MKVFVIIVTYNGMNWIKRCLSSLRESAYPVQIIVVDNLSADGTPDYITQNFPEVFLINAEKNLGFGRANNIGLQKALAENADYVFLLNQDAFIAADCINILIEASAVNTAFKILSPFHLNYAGDAIEAYFNKYIIANEAPQYINDLYMNKVKKIYAVSFVHAAGWLLTIDTIKEIGGFDPLFYHYGEDNDYIQRVLFRNYKVGFVPHAIMFHKGTNEEFLNEKASFSFKRNFATIHLKNPKASFAGAVLVFTKGIFDGITSAIAYRSLKRIKEECKLGANVIKSIRRIKKSRQIQLRSLAYLNK